MQVRILSLDPEDVMGVLAVQAVPSVPDSLLLIDSTAADISGKGDDAAGAGGLFLNIGSVGRCINPADTFRSSAIQASVRRMQPKPSLAIT